MRSRTILCVSSRRASSSAVIFGSFLFLAILFLQHLPNSPDVLLDVAEQTHDSCDVSVLNRQLDRASVTHPGVCAKCRFRTLLTAGSACQRGETLPLPE